MTGRSLIISILIFIVSYTAQSQHYVDSLETKFILVDNVEKLKILDELIPYYFRNEPQKAIKSAEKMEGIAKQIGDKRYEIKASRYAGLSLSYIKSYHEEALRSCHETEIIAKSNGFIEELILTKLAIADIYVETGNYTKALSYQLEAVYLSDSMNYLHLQSIILNNQAKCYIQLKEQDKAELCLKAAQKNAKLNEQTETIAETYMIYGELFDDVLNHPRALAHFQMAHDIYLGLRKDLHIAIALFNIGKSHFALDSINLSFQYHLRALNIRYRIKDLRGLAESYNEIGHLCVENGEFQRAVSNLKLGLFYAEKINSNMLMQNSFFYLTQAYLGLDDFKNAHNYQAQYSDISDLIYSEANARRVQELASQNDIAQREQQIKSLQDNYEFQEKQLANRNKFIVTLIVLLVVVGISIYFFIQSYREKRKINKELKEINAKVIKQNETLTELNSTKDKFFSIIGHDLKGPLNSLTSFSQLLINHTASLTEEEIRTVAKDLDKSLKNLYELLENLLGWARSQTGRLEFVAENFKLAKVIKENIRLLSKAALNKRIKMEMILDENVSVYADINSIKTVIRNLLSNAIKFTNEEGVISIVVDEWKDSVEIGIHDTGVGMNEDVMKKIFDISAKHSTLGTNKEKGTGLGLILCKEFIERNNGTLTVESQADVGSTFKFTLPKTQLNETVILEEEEVNPN